MVKADKPFNECHWIKEGIFLAGEYPRNLDEDSSQIKINQILNSGIKSFVDLTEEDELKPYAKFLNDPIKYRRFPIKDLSIPHSKEFVIILLDYIDSEISNNQPVYMHCWGGRGWTGTFAGCWLTRSEGSGQSALDRYRKLWSQNSKSNFSDSPETEQQCDFVRNWQEEKHG